MRRKAGSLLPLELAVLAVGLDFATQGQQSFHGYAAAQEISDRDGARRLTGHGTLYRALDRLEQAGLLESSLEDAAIAAMGNRPRRRLYRVTSVGEAAVLAHQALPAHQPDFKPGPARS